MHNFLEMVTYHLQKVMLLHLQHLLHIISLYHHFTSPWLSSLMACRWQVATLSWAAMYTVTFTFQCLYLNYTEKYNWRQMIQISEGKSALWWEQKRQMSGGKCDKLGGGKCAEGKWYIAEIRDYLQHTIFEHLYHRGQNMSNDLDNIRTRQTRGNHQNNQMKPVCILLGLVVSWSTFLLPIWGRTSFNSPLVIFFHLFTSIFQSIFSSLSIIKSWIPTTCDALSKTDVFLNFYSWFFRHNFLIKFLIFLTKFLNVNQTVKCWPNFGISTKIWNCHQNLEFQPNYRSKKKSIYQN